MANEWYLWLDLTKTENHDEFVNNHVELRQTFNDLGKIYTNLQIHDGDFDKLPDCVIVLANYQHHSSRYAMAKTVEQFKTELDSLKNDLVHASLEKRVIGPTNRQEDVIEYADNFELEKIIARLEELRRKMKWE